MSAFAAIDLGASSGRVMLAQLDESGVRLREVLRFPNRPVPVAGRLHWDVLSLWAGVCEGLRLAARVAPLAGIGIDSWAIDYGLLDADGALLGNPVHYRDARTDGVAERVATTVPPQELYALTGVQVLPFNTIYQLVSSLGSTQLAAARHALLVPDLFGYWLTGEVGAELTNASTTGLLDVRAGAWSADLVRRLGLPAGLLPAVRLAGSLIGTVRPDVAADAGLPADVPVFAVGSHDTASAVAAVPARGPRFAYISSGTWSLVGVELAQPVTSDAARRANFSNELGVDGTVRFLRNVMGLWLLQECVRTWERAGRPVDLDQLLTEAARAEGGRSVVDPDRPEFLAPGDMPDRLRAECARTGQPEPRTAAETVRCILDSLAAAYGRTVRAAEALTGARIEVVHVVGGGGRNELLCQLTADACRLPVVAGPVEAAALGNALVQARAADVLHGGLPELRELVARLPNRRYEPRS